MAARDRLAAAEVSASGYHVRRGLSHLRGGAGPGPRSRERREAGSARFSSWGTGLESPGARRPARGWGAPRAGGGPWWPRRRISEGIRTAQTPLRRGGACCAASPAGLPWGCPARSPSPPPPPPLRRGPSGLQPWRDSGLLGQLANREPAAPASLLLMGSLSLEAASSVTSPLLFH